MPLAPTCCVTPLARPAPFLCHSGLPRCQKVERAPSMKFSANFRTAGRPNFACFSLGESGDYITLHNITKLRLREPPAKLQSL